MPVYFYKEPIPENVCADYRNNEAALFQDLGNERGEAIRCLTRRIKPLVEAKANGKGIFDMEAIDNIVMDTVIATIRNIQRGRIS